MGREHSNWLTYHGQESDGAVQGVPGEERRRPHVVEQDGRRTPVGLVLHGEQLDGVHAAEQEEYILCCQSFW